MFLQYLRNLFFVLTELRNGRLTVGKIYAGFLILENWKTTRFGQIPGVGLSVCSLAGFLAGLFPSPLPGAISTVARYLITRIYPSSVSPLTIAFSILLSTVLSFSSCGLFQLFFSQISLALSSSNDLNAVRSKQPGCQSLAFRLHSPTPSCPFLQFASIPLRSFVVRPLFLPSSSFFHHFFYSGDLQRFVAVTIRFCTPTQFFEGFELGCSYELFLKG